ncbi:MAG: inositol monophosphatase family protein [Pseudomonadota bacterium]
MTSVTDRHLDIALEAATKAASIIKQYFNQDFEVQLKADESPVTQADIECEHAIKGILQSAFPDYGFFGEETGTQGLESEYLWLVDPIDGTKSFVRGYPFFSTQIALMHQGEIVLGVSSAPLFDELAWATKGKGAFLNKEPIAVSDISSIDQATLSLGNVATLAGGPGWDETGRLIRSVNRIRGYGDFYHYHLLASGKIDIVIESDVNILDIAALTCIVSEAGGSFTQLDGAPIGLESTSVMATNRRVLQELSGFQLS